MVNVWRRGSLTRNPYLRTAFRVARVPRETVKHKTIVALIGNTQQVVSADKQAHKILGEPVTEAQVNAAEQILLDAGQRILEELLEHATERPPLETVRKLARKAAEAMAVEQGSSLASPVTNLSGLESWDQAVVREFLERSPGPDPSFGALELDVVPPFGRAAEE